MNFKMQVALKKSRFLFFFSITFLFLLIHFPVFSQKKQEPSYEVINQVVAVVGNLAITNIDLENAEKEFQRRRDLPRDKRNISSQALDILISRLIVRYTAKEESITVSKNQVDKEVERQMQSQGVLDLEAFKKTIKQQWKFEWEDYLQEVENQLYARQVMQIRVPVVTPSEEKVRDWYNKNKRKLGKKYFVRVIQKKYKKNDYKDELRVSKIMKTARVLAEKNFAQAASRYSEHSSAKNGGSIGWVRPEEVAASDRLLAGAIVNLPLRSVSQVFVGERGYYIVKVEQRANIQLEEVYNYIVAFLYNESEQKAFMQWLEEQRSKISIQIFLDNYREG